MLLKKLTLALSAVALSFSVSAFAQQPAPQPEQQAPTNPAGEVIGKLASMGHMQFGDFPVTQTELDRASEFVQARAAQSGKTITRDQSLVALGYIAGQLGVFMQLQGNAQQQAPDDDLGPTPQAVPAPQAAPQTSQQPAPQGAPQAAPAAPAVPQSAPQANVQLPPGAVQTQPIEIVPNGMMMGNGPMMGNAPMMIYAPEVGATGQAPVAPAQAPAQAPSQAPAQTPAPQSAQQ